MVLDQVQRFGSYEVVDPVTYPVWGISQPAGFAYLCAIEEVMDRVMRFQASGKPGRR